MVRLWKRLAGSEQPLHLGDLPVTRGFFRRGKKVAKAELETRQQGIGHSRGHPAGSFEDVVQVRLGDSDVGCKSAFGKFSRRDAAADLGDEESLHLPPLHRYSIYLNEICW